jgi:predicted transcriptional regulator
MTPRQVRIDDEQYGALEEIGWLEDRSVSYLIRQAIKLFLEHKAQERQAQSRSRRK